MTSTNQQTRTLADLLDDARAASTALEGALDAEEAAVACGDWEARDAAWAASQAAAERLDAVAEAVVAHRRCGPADVTTLASIALLTAAPSPSGTAAERLTLAALEVAVAQGGVTVLPQALP
ncbi:hypothetical protein [Salinarimonas soli]|uniref:Uncharacterized protein n=1 Tax=Salinarimonas soli TaxID=1638099 RepID=A0A5B2VF85_9HYPH|nr:hypothetical protein [Salinarimonas soli]KAA2236969.1 hypothetical protein F0L46_11900 [Salinarimonas soli]